MGAFFTGWRRKIGCLTLVMACIFMACWIRSLSCDDCVDAWITRHSTFHVISSNSSLTFGYAWEDGGEPNVVVLNGTTVKEALGDSSKLLDWNSFPLEETAVDYFVWEWDSCGFSFAANNYEPIHKKAIRVLDAYFILPLTLLSAFLLLTKPRKSTPKMCPEPVPAGEA